MTCPAARVVRVPAPQARVVRYPVPAQPSIVRQEIPGIPGPRGATGPVGVTTGFGQATFTHVVTAPGDFFDAGARTPLAFAPDPGLSVDYLNPPFAGHAFWDGTRIVGRALADFLLIQVNLQVSAMVGSGTLTGDLDAGSSLGPLVSDTYNLSPAAQVVQRVTLKLFTQTLLNLMASGGRIFLTCSVPAMIVRESIVVAPLSLYAGATP
ncbi:hypothetical protein [Methylobacterium sp. Gmos1]